MPGTAALELAERLQQLRRWGGNDVYLPLEPERVYLYLNDVLLVLGQAGLYPSENSETPLNRSSQ
jgi:hypothetical protein